MFLFARRSANIRSLHSVSCFWFPPVDSRRLRLVALCVTASRMSRFYEQENTCRSRFRHVPSLIRGCFPPTWVPLYSRCFLRTIVSSALRCSTFSFPRQAVLCSYMCSVVPRMDFWHFASFGQVLDGHCLLYSILFLCLRVFAACLEYVCKSHSQSIDGG